MLEIIGRRDLPSVENSGPGLCGFVLDLGVGAFFLTYLYSVAFTFLMGALVCVDAATHSRPASL